MRKPVRKSSKRSSKKPTVKAKVVTRGFGKLSGIKKIPTVRKAKYKVGDKVYTYQNQQEKMPIIEVKAIIDDAPAINFYRLLIRDAKGGFTKGNWISELSIYTVKRKTN